MNYLNNISKHKKAVKFTKIKLKYKNIRRRLIHGSTLNFSNEYNQNFVFYNRI